VACVIDTMTWKPPVSISKLPALQWFKTLEGLSGISAKRVHQQTARLPNKKPLS